MESSGEKRSGGEGKAQRRMGPEDVNSSSSETAWAKEALLSGLARFAAIFYNASGSLECLGLEPRD